MPANRRPTQPTPLLSRFIDRYSTSVAMLVTVWVIGVETRRYLAERGSLSETGYEALTSLIYVVPIMLAGWGMLAIADRLFDLGLFSRDDE